MLYTSVVKKETPIWVNNGIEKISKKTNFDVGEDVIIQELPTGRLIEIVWNEIRNDFMFTIDGISEEKLESSFSEYLKKDIYPNLLEVASEFSFIDTHFYGYDGKDGMHFVDMYVNENWIDWDLAEHLFMENKLRTVKTIHKGTIKSFDHTKSKRFIIRSVTEPSSSTRKIYYYKTN